jgi:hypothetical protein
MTLRNLARLGLTILLLTGLVAGGVHAKAASSQALLASQL